ncbi:TetR/AcrR family transcriptional regulator [Phytoactinopolyspora alkaliphila]|uniref:TetR/AcrR family transcriptional regulator n=1 Tax=Phytoactinopolyspora alkaliphila TaxID=1783498 RepID=A0A6N9YPD0_9ACTN|nr:TetR/AcrR family transcriptional regulator [Phytoactinopolyspora alkaliphila]NED96807.1 TetR/AcrR family transcriptional regulator [Phytoactinopolyspora alkaliphila]
MPRVSQEHRDQRRQQILTAARRCFVREGFHQTSMADILAEAHLSAGAVYGHFNSKNDIIAAIAEDVIGQISQLLEPIVTQEPTPSIEEAVLQVLTATNEMAFGEDAFASLAPQVWAEALRNDALGEVFRRKYVGIQQLIAQLVTAEQNNGRVAPTVAPDEIAKVLLSVIMGYILQRLLVGNVEPESYAAGLAAIGRPG